MSEAAKEIKACIRFYEARGWDWVSAVGFIACKSLGVGTRVIRTRIGVGYGRPKGGPNT